MSRTGENIYKRKDGRWEGRYIKERSPSGKAIYGYVYARSYRDLKVKMSAVKVLEESIPNTIAEPAFILFKSVCEDWLISKQAHIKESTYVKYSNLLNSYILPDLGEKNIMSLNHDQLDAFCRKLLKEGGKKEAGLSPKTVSDAISLIRSILQYSANKGNVPVYNGKSISVRQEQKDMRVLTKAEQDILCKYLYFSENPRDLGLLICLFTGLRVGEICALKWGDISLTEKTLFVHQTMQRIQVDNSLDEKKTKILISTPKSKCSIRMIPLTEELVEILSKHKHSADTYVLTGDINKYVEPRTMQNHFKRTINICSMEDANFHSLRHSFATRCVEVGFDIKSLSEILGHASVNITMNRYVHPSLDLKRENMNRLSALFSVK